MPYFPSNVLLHDSIFSENYDQLRAPHADAHLTSTPLYTMNPLGPPSDFPSPAPQLVLSRPVSQQFQVSSIDKEHDARFVHHQHHPKPSTSLTYPEGHERMHERQFSQISPGWEWNFKPHIQPPYVPSAPYNYPVNFYANPGNPVNQRHAAPVHESTGLYGVYVQPEGRRDYRLSSQTSLSASSTPLMYRMSARRPPGDQSFIPAPQLASCLQKDLKDNIFTIFPNYFLDDIWPNSALPCPLTMNIFNTLTANQIWDENNDRFFTPPAELTESSMAEWLNALGGMIGAFTNNSGFERKRSWSAGTCDKQPDGASINRKPDLVLVDRPFVDTVNRPDGTAQPHVSWTAIHAFAEVTRSYPLPKRIISTINDKTYLLFISQHDRRYVPALSFNGQAEFALTLTDRQGQLTTPFISFLHGKANAFLFMKILTFLMYGPLHNTGRDTTMELHSNGRVKAIVVNGHRYEVVYLIYSLQSMIGRGTTIWLVVRKKRYYILKDSWIQVSRVGSEIKFLEALKDDRGLEGHVPYIVDGEDVCVGGSVDSTGRYRTNVGGLHDARTHRRLVMSPIGKQITSFKSIVEFISALIDIIGVLQRLHDCHNILHRDISPNNLMLVHPDGEITSVRRGLLIDFDYAAMLGRQSVSPGVRTGTPPFMAVDLMLHQEKPGNPFQHELRHDLESILYVILWICTSMKGPSIERRVEDPLFMNLPLRKWFDRNADIRDLGYSKLGHIVDAENAIFINFPPFWNPFKPFVRELLAAFIFSIAGCRISPNSDPKSYITSQVMIEILKRAIEHIDAGTKEPSDLSPDPGEPVNASYNEIFHETTSHAYLFSPQKRAGADEPSGHQSKKGKKSAGPEIYNFQNWTPSVEEKLSRRPVIDG